MGTTYEATTIATGFGAHLAQPLLRKAVEGREGQIEEAEAARILEEAMRVLYYRDARSLDRIQMAKVTGTGGVVISAPFVIASDWSVGRYNEETFVVV